MRNFEMYESEDFLTTEKRLCPLSDERRAEGRIPACAGMTREEGLDSSLRWNDECPIGKNTEGGSEGIIRFTRGLFYGLGLSAVLWVLIIALVRLMFY